jgi:hypothetical protein
LDCKSSSKIRLNKIAIEDYILALDELEKALLINPNITEISDLYDSLKADIDRQKKGEKKVFKSFFRNVNKVYEEKEKEVIRLEKSDIGKPELKLLDL